MRLPLIVAEVTTLRARGHDEIVISDQLADSRRAYDPPCGINSVHLAHQDRDIALIAQQVPNGRGNFGRGQHGRRHLIQQRLKQVMIRPIDQHYFDRDVF